MSNSSLSKQLPTVIIKDDEAFSALCRDWSEGVTLALDTEFVRTNTFYSNIGLLQLADTNACYLVDPLCIKDWSEFSQLLVNPACSFVIHSCSEDLNLLYTFLGVVPLNLFDTQVAAAFVGMGYSISYQALVNELLGIELDKGETRSDWLRRPLSERQLEYAALDVLYLLELQAMLQAQLEDKGMLGWLQAECDSRVENATGSEQEATWQLIYAGFSNAWRMSDLALSYLQKLCYWREQESRHRNKPRSWIIKDQDLGAIAIHMANAAELSLSELSDVKVSERKLLARNAEKIIALLERDDMALAAVDRAALNGKSVV